ncbi:MAG: glycoside hydrolase family 2 TIM barrel-domain containing protein [Bacteroidales bacterium]
MKKVLLPLALFLFAATSIFAQADKVSVVNNNEGARLLVNGQKLMINGMNWDYFPVGTNYTYSLWKQPDEFIKTALDTEMPLLKNMGVNAIRIYAGIQPKWIKYIYEKYGIYTMINHSFGRYGLTINGKWEVNTEYSDQRVHDLLLSEVNKIVQEYQNTPGLLLYLLGNENNYGLFWQGAETEDIPIEKRKSTAGAIALYNLFNEAALSMKTIDNSHPVAICNGDLLFLDIIAKECKDVDILGVNMYRGVSFGDAFQKTKEVLNKPIMFTEFGSDAFNTINSEEDQQSQAYYLTNNWKEIYQNAAGLGKAGNCIGGFTFMFSDGWWKYKQNENLDIHDNNASWSNGGYLNDYKAGENNMNEEWFGICAKGQTDARGHYLLYPRAAYYALQQAHKQNPYAPGLTADSINTFFSKIQLTNEVLKARGDKALSISEIARKIRISGVRAEITTYSTGGKMITTPKENNPGIVTPTYPSYLGFDHMESFYVGVEVKPTENVKANVSFNILGNVADNPIDEIFYETRGRTQEVQTSQGTLAIRSLNRVQLYNFDFTWYDKWFNLKGFYRTGHYHWGYEGDFFGLYPEANYGPNIDIYNGDAPFGFEFEGKKSIEGLKVAFGPQLWWGGNPAVLVKYSRKLSIFDISGIYHDDIAQNTSAQSSYAIPTPRTRRASLDVKTKLGVIGLDLGALWSGQPRIGETFQIVDGTEGNYNVYQDKITLKDTWGGKAKITLSAGPINWYAQGAVMGLVAYGGADYTRTFTGWRLKDSGSGNQYNFLTGFTYTIGDFQIAPNFLWQKPIVGPISNTVPAPGRPRNILEDPFSVRQNRQTTAGELLISYDPTPATWLWAWDSDEIEDAPFAISADFIYRHLPTTQDAAIGIMANGRTIFAFPGAPPAHDLWEVSSRIISKVNPNLGFIVNLYGGNAQANGSDARIIERLGGDLRFIYKKVKLISAVKVNDWGPYDYHRDFNLTYPLQLMADLSYSVAKRKWFILPETRVGISCTWRSLDQYSPRYCPTRTLNNAGEWVADPTAVGYGNGEEWEIRTYVRFSLGL